MLHHLLSLLVVAALGVEPVIDQPADAVSPEAVIQQGGIKFDTDSSALQAPEKANLKNLEKKKRTPARHKKGKKKRRK